MHPGSRTIRKRCVDCGYTITATVYSKPMTKRLVEIDDRLLEQARAATGASTIRATVEAALRRVVGEEAVRRHVEWLRSGDGLDLDVLADIRASRFSEGA